MINKDQNQIVIYKTKTGAELKVKLQEETVWLSQKQMAKLFDCSIDNISLHLKNVYSEGELVENLTIEESSVVQKEGGRNINRRMKIYNLDAIISVGYRINSLHGTQFRIWATNTLRNYLVKGYAINKSRLQERGLDEFERAVALIKHTMETKQLTSGEAKGLLKVITDYANSWLLLHKYDKGELDLPVKKTVPKYKLTYDEAVRAIDILKEDLIAREEATNFFGKEREKMILEGVINNLYQTFNGKELYEGVDERAAHLLYFVIKDHPLVDGNKRTASFLFIVFLANNHYLLNKKGERKFSNNALVALALLIAKSDRNEKDLMIKLVMNFLRE